MFSAARTLFISFFEICRFRLRPQDMPASRALLLVTALAYLGVDAILAGIDLPAADAVLTASLETAGLAGYTAVVLGARGHHARIEQTLIALLGSGLVLGLVAWPVVTWLHVARTTRVDVGAPALLWLPVFVWSLLVSAHVYRHALSVRFGVGFLVTVVYVGLVLSVAGMLGARA